LTLKGRLHGNFGSLPKAKWDVASVVLWPTVKSNRFSNGSRTTRRNSPA
jgi:hypothetical protein